MRYNGLNIGVDKMKNGLSTQKTKGLEAFDISLKFYLQVVVLSFQTVSAQPQNVTLVLRKPKTQKKIQWSEETVDNEDMGKKKSKCEQVVVYAALNQV